MSGRAVAYAGVPRVNLLPRAEVARRENAALIRRWMVGVLAALVVVALAAAGAFWLRMTADQRMALAQAETMTLLEELAALGEVSQAAATLTALEGFRAEAMASDIEWASLERAVTGVLPVGVVITGFDLTSGAAPIEAASDETPAADDAPGATIGMTGTFTISSPTPLEMPAIIRALRQQPGFAFTDGRAITSEVEGEGSVRVYDYLLGVDLDQTLYTGEYAAEEDR